MKTPRPWPHLSKQLDGPRHPQFCQSCHRQREPADLLRWQECDALDQATDVAVVLCAACSKKIIEPHPRLYLQTDWGEAFPGAMACCPDCDHRDGLACRNPLLKANGGPGLRISEHVYARCIACSGSRRAGNRCRPFAIYTAPPDCDGLTRAGHAVGDRGQRYEIRAIMGGWEIVICWCEQYQQQAVDAIAQHPEVSRAWVVDRKPDALFGE